MILILLAFITPILVLPGVIDNAFKTPKHLLIVITAALLWVLWDRRTLSKKTMAFMGAIAGLNFFNLLYTQNPYYTKVAVVLNLSCLSIFFFTSLSDKKIGILLASTLSGTIVAIISILQYLNIFLIFKWSRPGMMVVGTIGNSNYLGAYLLFPLMFGIGLLFYFKNRWRLLLLPCVGLIFTALIFSRARAAWFGFFFGFITLMALMKPWKGLKVKTGVAIVLMTVAIGANLYSFGPPRLRTMLQTKQVFKSDTFLLRTQKYFAASWWLIKQNPLFGQGLWSYRKTVYEAQAQIEQAHPGFFQDYPEPKPRRVHCEYMEILNDGGVVSGVVLLIFLVFLIKRGLRAIGGVHGSLPNPRIAIALSTTISILVCAVFFFPFRVSITLYLTSTVLGILGAEID